MKTNEEIAQLAQDTYPVLSSLDWENIHNNYNRYKFEGFVTGYTQAQEADNWVSVKDRLPEHSLSVLVWVIGKSIYPHHTTAIHLKDNIWSISGIQWDSSCVTHWQPMPSKPKEVESI